MLPDSYVKSHRAGRPVASLMVVGYGVMDMRRKWITMAISPYGSKSIKSLLLADMGRGGPRFGQPLSKCGPPRLAISTPRTPVTALPSNLPHCSSQNIPVTVSSCWKRSKSFHEAVCVPLVFLSAARRAAMLNLSRRLGNCPPLIQARPVEALQVSKALGSPIRTLMTKSRIKANRKKASLNKPKQETADFEKAN